MRPTLVSLQVGVPQTIERDGREISTGIYKFPVSGRVRLGSLNLEGDRQADPTVHGGRDKAVYAYPSEHYLFWKKELPDMNLPWGSFGENFTTLGLLEGAVCIGDRYTIGTAEVVVTQPRIPCYKLNARIERDDMAKRFLASHRSGFYLRVLREGELGPGDEIMLTQQDENRVTVSDVLNIYLHGTDSNELIQQILRVEYLSASWREEFLQQA